MNKTVNDLKTERESIKKTHTKGILGMKSLGTETETTEASYMNRIQEMKGRLSHVEDMLKEDHQSKIMLNPRNS